MSPLLTQHRQSHWQFALSLIVLVVVIGVLGYMLVSDLGPLDALYMTLITVATIGYNDMALQHTQHPELTELFTMSLIIFGFVAVAYSFSIFTRSLIEGELAEMIGRQRTIRRVASMRNHYIVCGYGRMGETIADRLQQENIPVLVIERAPEKRLLIEQRGLTCLIGDATHDEVLKLASIGKAHSLITVTDSDPENLFVTISARQLNPQLHIVSLASSEEAQNKMLRAGANRVILPYKLGALQLAQAALRPNVVDFIEIATKTSSLDIEIEELVVQQTSPLSGKPLKEAPILRDLGLIVIGIRCEAGGRMEFNPSAETVIHSGDTLIALGKTDALKQIYKHLS